MTIFETLPSFRPVLATMMTDRMAETKKLKQRTAKKAGAETAELPAEETVKPEDGSLDKYLSAVKRFAEAVKDKRIDSLEELDFVEYLGKMKLEGYSGSYIALQKAALVRYVEYLNRYRKFTTFTARDLKTGVTVKVGKRLPKPIDRVDVMDILEQAENVEDRFMVSMLFNCGLRSHEFVRLEKAHFVLHRYADEKGEAKEMRAVKFPGKGDSERLVPLNKAAMEIVDQYFGFRDMKFPKGWRKVWDYSYSYTYKRVRKLASKAGVENVSPHTFRHSFATELLRKSAPITTIQNLMGHSDIATTMIYTKIHDETKVAAVNLLDDKEA